MSDSLWPHGQHSPWEPHEELSSVQSHNHVWLFTTPWTAARHASQPWWTPKACSNMSIESVMPSNNLILCHPLLLLPSIFPSIRVFSQWVSSLHQVANVLEFQLQHSAHPMNIQDWLPLELTGWISLQSKGLSRVFSNTIVQKHQFFGAQLSL